MRTGGCVIAIVMAAAVCAAHVTLAEPVLIDPPSSPDQRQAAGDAQAQSVAFPSLDPGFAESARLLVFSNADVWRHGGFAHGGALWAPDGVDRDGFVLKLMFGGGLYHYTSGALANADVVGRQYSASILPGYRLIRGPVTFTMFLGYDFQHHGLTPDDPSAGLRGSYSGVRAAFELWYQPVAWGMVTADASFSTIGPSYNARLAAGIRTLDWFYVGPEVQAFAAGDNYRQLRAGLHVTGLRLDSVEWSAGAGWALDNDDRSGIYGKLGLLTRH